MMNLNEFAKEIHTNAVEHGWWDEPRPFDELCALMISELAEALEEARAGRPMEWYSCPMSHKPCKGSCGMVCDPITMRPKPEGIAVEMADCAIRILDYLGSVEWDIEKTISEKTDGSEDRNIVKKLPTAFMVASHLITNAWQWIGLDDTELTTIPLVGALVCILNWFEANGLDFEDIARRKHEYNKTRPYKHGKEF